MEISIVLKSIHAYTTELYIGIRISLTYLIDCNQKPNFENHKYYH